MLQCGTTHLKIEDTIMYFYKLSIRNDFLFKCTVHYASIYKYSNTQYKHHDKNYVYSIKNNNNVKNNYPRKLHLIYT